MLAGLVNCESHSFVEPFKDIVIRVRIDIRTKFVILFFKVVRVLFWGGGGGGIFKDFLFAKTRLGLILDLYKFVILFFNVVRVFFFLGGGGGGVIFKDFYV